MAPGFSSSSRIPPQTVVCVAGDGVAGGAAVGRICAARDVDGCTGSMAITVAPPASEWGSVSEYGGAGSAAIPMGPRGSGSGDCGTPAAADVGVVRLHMRITSS